MNLSKMSGKPIEIEISGKKYKASPTSIGHVAEYEQFVKSRRLEQFLLASKKAELEKESIIAGIQGILNAPLTAEDISRELSTMVGAQFLVWKAIEENHPEFTLEDAARADDLDVLVEVLGAISGIGRLVDGENPFDNQEKKKEEQ